MALSKLQRRTRIKYRIRKIISGTASKPRLSVYRSNKEIYAQLVDDVAGKTLVSASSLEVSLGEVGKNNTQVATAVGVAIAERAKKAGIKEAYFDRGGYLFHGKVKALAEAAREGGLKI